MLNQLNQATMSVRRAQHSDTLEYRHKYQYTDTLARTHAHTNIHLLTQSTQKTILSEMKTIRKYQGQC